MTSGIGHDRTNLAEREGASDDQPHAVTTAHESHGSYLALINAVDQGFCTIELKFDDDQRPVDYLFLHVSPSFERQTGIENATGCWMRDIAPDLDQVWFDTFGRVALTGEPEQFENFSTPLDRWFSVNALKIDGPGRVAILFDDITDRKRAEAALRASEERFRNVLENMGEAFALLDRDFRIVELNAEAMRLEGRPREAIIGKTHWEAHPGAAPEITDLFRLAMAEQREVSLEHRYVWPHGRDTWIAMRAFPVGDGLAVFYRDVTDRKVASEAMRESEERQTFLLQLSDMLRAEPGPEAIANRALQMLFERMGLDRCFIGIYRLEDDTGEFPHQVHDERLLPLPAHIRLSDFPEALEIVSDRTLVIDDVAKMDGLSDADRASFDGLDLRAIVTATVRKGKNNPLWAIVAGSMHPRAWTRNEVSIVEDVAERTWAAVEQARAEEELRDSERHQGLLLAELQHRVRNILTMVRSVARRTSENCDDVEDYVRHLEGRLSSMARVQTILTRQPGQGTGLHDLVRDELEMQVDSPDQVRIEGPEVELAPKAAEVLSLAIHELATNSIKYGALSGASDIIRINWSIDDRDGQAWLRFNWNEPFAPQPGRPSRIGFGTDLIRNRVPYELHGTGDIQIGADAVEARIEFPLAIAPSNPGGGAIEGISGR